ncbi:MAG: rRNA synthase [Candidatus Sumerlaeota bacterium]|nr:rRNA synthase [Candidatus Sumerlaeota bacterium]
MSDPLRISRFLARCGIASRRKAEEIVSAGRVRLNGVVTTNLATRINPDEDVVELDGKHLKFDDEKVTLVVNKPRGVLVSRGDPQKRPTVYDILPEEHKALAGRLVYVGRLDYMTEGMLLLTTDGDLANRLTHPSKGVEKEYLAWTSRELTIEECAALEEGVDIGDDTPAPGVIRRIEGPRPLYSVKIHEGRNRQVRRMFETIGVGVARLKRIRIGGLELQRLPTGEWRKLTPKDLALLLKG